MYKYVLKRLLYMIPVVLGVAFLVFVILSLTRGIRDPSFWGSRRIRRILPL